MKMLSEIADGVFVRQSKFCQSNAVVICGDNGVLLVDPGVDGSDLNELADDLAALNTVVIAGFSTHPHWDHLLWHPRFGDVTRYGTTGCEAVARTRLSRFHDMADRLAPGAHLDLLGLLTPLPTGSTELPWVGPTIRVIAHQAHAPGHAALLIESTGVLVAGDMLSDVEVPLLDPETTDPAGDYLEALELLAGASTGGVTAVVPGHGSVAGDRAIRQRIEADRTYIHALRNGDEPADSRLRSDATYGTDWLPEAHERNIHLARR